MTRAQLLRVTANLGRFPPAPEPEAGKGGADVIDRQRVGGMAALVAAATFVFGFVMFASVLSDYTSGDPTPRESVAFLVDHQAALYIWSFVILVVFGVALIPLVLAIHDRLSAVAPGVAPIATVLGLVWSGLVIAAGLVANVGMRSVVDLYDDAPSRAETVWSSVDAIQNGLGGGNEVVGGLWVLLVSGVALRTGLFRKGLAVLGIVAGVAALTTVVPALEAVGAVFGLGLIVWFAWVGVLLLRAVEPVVERADPDDRALRNRAAR
jgi:Domain of unknown function (DUF4386)